jgi:short-subunit dehydrogenase
MLAGGQEGHVVNTASLAGIMYANSIYSVSKHAVVALSEAVRAQLAVANAPVGISVLCPGVVDTNILDADRNRPPALRVDAPPPTEEMRAADEEARRNLERGLAPSSIAAAVVDGIREGRFFIIPVQDEIRDGVRSAVRRRADSIVKALGR